MTARPSSFWWLLTIPAACLFILGMSDPVLFLWAFAGLLIGWALTASWMWGVWHDRAVNAEGRAIFAENEVAHLKRMYGDATPVPLVQPDLWQQAVLRVVPAPREPWPPVARAVEAETTPIHDDTAVDLFMRSVDRWGEDAER